MMVLRKHLVKITVIFLSLFALASLLKFFHLTERFATKAQWQKVVIALLDDLDTFEYTYGINTYKINKIKKMAIKKYIKSIKSGDPPGTHTSQAATACSSSSACKSRAVNFSDFTSYVGVQILKGEKEAAKEMINKYAKEKMGHAGFTGTLNSKRIYWPGVGKTMKLYDTRNPGNP
jgi:hypothetical protein